MRSYLLQARKAYVLPPLFLPCTQSEKDRERVSALPGINLSGVVAGSAGRSRRSLCARAAIRHSIKPNNIHRPIDLFSQRGRVRYQLPSRQHREKRVANGNRKLNGAVWWPRLMTPCAISTITLIVFLNNEDKKRFFFLFVFFLFFYVGARKLTKFSRNELSPVSITDICEMPRLARGRGKR